VYKINTDDTVGISVSARKEKLNFSSAEKTFEIGKIWARRTAPLVFL